MRVDDGLTVAAIGLIERWRAFRQLDPFASQDTLQRRLELTNAAQVTLELGAIGGRDTLRKLVDIGLPVPVSGVSPPSARQKCC